LIRSRSLGPLPRTALVAVGAVAFALFAWWLDRRMLGVSRDAYFGFTPVLANALPGLLAALLLTVLTRRPGLSLLLACGLQALVYRIGTMKLEVLSDPLGLQDLYFVTNLTPDSFALLGQYVQHPWLLGGLVALAGAIAGLWWWIERPAFRAFRIVHVCLALVAAGLLATLVSARQPWEGVYDQATLRPSKFKAMPGILHAGLMSSLVYSHIQNKRTLDTLNEVALERLLSTVPPQPAPADTGPKPDIVVILSESLFDPRRMQGMAELPDTVPNVRAAIASGYGGAMKVPAYGGGTVRTEFEVLTGMPMEAFPEAQFPYVTLVRERIPSLVSQVEKSGYTTLAIHGNAGSFWNRRNAYHAMGVDRFITKDEFPAGARHDGLWISDAVMTDLILDALGHRDGPAPKFVIALSIEAHGPYRMEKGMDAAELAAIGVPAGLKPAEAESLRSYIYHARHADAQLGRLMDTLRARSRPTVVLFFGDHLPGILKVYDQLGFVDGKTGPRQLVPWVLWRSDQPQLATGYDGDMQSWMLPAKVLQVAGLGNDPFFAIEAAVSDRLRDATGPERRMLLNGMDALAVARINGSLPQRLAAHAQAKHPLAPPPVKSP
jgi:phosphoglycerol transferase MdoB-like AlkP superfamily enzyme